MPRNMSISELQTNSNKKMMSKGRENTNLKNQSARVIKKSISAKALLDDLLNIKTPIPKKWRENKLSQAQLKTIASTVPRNGGL
jgi:hypothetical protein